MRRGGAAAAADDVDIEFLDELDQRVGKRLRLQRVDRLPVHVERQAGVGDAGDRQGGLLAQEADRLAHVIRAGGAVQPDHVDAQAFQDGQHGGDIGAEQHAPGGIQGHLGLDGQAHAGFFEGLLDAANGGFHLQDILRGLDQQQVDPALDQPAACSRKISASSSKVTLESSGSSIEGSLPDGPIEPATKRGWPVFAAYSSARRRAREAAARLISMTRSCRPYSPRVRRLERKVSGLDHIHARLPGRSGAPSRPPAG